jgi:hypothetical protein
MKSCFLSVLFLIILAPAILAQTGAAQTLNFVNTEYVGDEQVELLVYSGNGTFLGTLNTTTPLSIPQSDPETDLVIYQRVKQVNLITNPTAWLSWLIMGGGIGIFLLLVIVATVKYAFSKGKNYS